MVNNQLPRTSDGPIAIGLKSSDATDRLQRRPGPRPLVTAQTQCRSVITRFLTGRLNVISPQQSLLFDRPKLDVGVVLANPLGNMQPANRMSGLTAVSVGPAPRYKVGPFTTGGIVG